MQKTPFVDQLRDLLQKRDKISDRLEGASISVARRLTRCFEDEPVWFSPELREKLVAWLEDPTTATEEALNAIDPILNSDIRSRIHKTIQRSTLEALHDLVQLEKINRRIALLSVAMHLESPPGLRTLSEVEIKRGQAVRRTRAKRKAEASSEQIEDQEWNEGHPKDGSWTGCVCHAPNDEDLSCEVLPGQADLFSDSN